MDRILAGLKRFAKGFMAGGLAQAGLVLSAGISFKSLAEAKALGTVLLAA
jgi:hypothetical protein